MGHSETQRRFVMEELITINISENPPKGLGRLKYKQLPRLHDWVEIDINEIGYMFEVVKLAHSSIGAGCDIYVKRLKRRSSALSDLYQSS